MTIESTGRAEKGARDMADLVNSLSFEVPVFIDEMARQHRTLQQSFTDLCFRWIYHLATLEESQYDGRNEAAVKQAKVIVLKSSYAALSEDPSVDNRNIPYWNEKRMLPSI